MDGRPTAALVPRRLPRRAAVCQGRSRTSLRLRALAVTSALAVALAQHPGDAGEPGSRTVSSPRQVAQELLDSLRTGDDAAFAAAAAYGGVDPFRVAGSLWVAFLQNHPTEPEKTARIRTALTQYAGAVRARSGGDLEPLLAAWFALDEAGMERERRLLGAIRTTNAALRAADWTRVLGEIANRADDLALPAHSLFVLSMLGNRGEALHALQRWAEAGAVFEDASGRAAAMGWSRRAGHDLDRATRSYSVGGLLREAERTARGAKRIQERCGLALEAATTTLGLAEVLIRLGRHEEASATLQAARAQLRTLAAQPERTAPALALSYLVEANLQDARGDLEAAYETGKRARQALTAAGDVDLAIGAGTNLAWVMMRSGRPSEAMTLLDRLRAEARALGPSATHANVLMSLGVLFVKLQMPGDALAALAEAADLAAAAGNHTLRAMVRGNIAVVRLESGQPAEALAEFQRLVDDPRMRLQPETEGITLMGMARALRALGRTADAERALGEALTVWRRQGDLRRQAEAHKDLGDLHLGAPDAQRAFAAFARAEALLERLGDRTDLRARVHHGMAAAHLQRGEGLLAMDAVERALAIDRLHWRGLADDEALGLRREAHATSEAGVEGAWLWSRGAPGRAREAAARALRFSESGRLLLLATALGNQDLLAQARLSPELRTEDAAARRDVDEARAEILRVVRASPQDGDRIRAARARLDRAWNRRERVLRRVQREARRAASVVYPEPVELTLLQRALAADEAFLGYSVQGQQAFAVVVTRDDAQLVSLGASAGLAQAVRGYMKLVASPEGPERELARELHGRLLGPALPALDGISRLLVAPDREIAYLPFDALLDAEHPRAERLVERFEVVMVPSATVYVMLLREERERPAASGLLAVGAPTYPRDSFAPLPGSAAEVRAIAALFPGALRSVRTGPEADVEGLCRELNAVALAGGRLRALHLACHAFVDSERPRLSGLALADGRVLDVGGLYRQRVPAALAVLSACDSGRGAITSAEGVLGLVRAFFYAGTTRIVAARWKVEDKGTRLLMQRFYERMLVKRQATGAALRAAKLDLLRESGARAHPYHWAAFALWGLAD